MKKALPPVVIVLALLATAAYAEYHVQYASFPPLQRVVAREGASSLAELARPRQEPSLAGWPSEGAAGAPLTLVVYGDLTGPATRSLLERLQLLNGESSSGLLKLYFKPLVTWRDREEGNARFLLAEKLSCLAERAPERYFAFVRAAVENPFVSAGECDDPNGDDGGERGERLDELMLEARLYGLEGVSPRSYLGVGGRDNAIIDGVPGEEWFRRAISQKKLGVGS